MSKLPNFWQFFNLTSQPTIPSLYWDSYSYEERIKKICDKIWAILNYLKLVMELLNEFDERLTTLEELYNALESRVTELERIVADHEERISELERILDELDVDEILTKLANIIGMIAPAYDEEETYNQYSLVVYEDNLYECTASTTGEFDPTKWTEISLGEYAYSNRLSILSLSEDLSDFEDSIANRFDVTESYSIGDYVVKDHSIYKALSAHAENDPWVDNNWQEVIVMEELISLKSDIGDLQSDIEDLKTDALTNLKFPIVSGDVSTIPKNHPIIFSSDEEYDDTDPSFTPGPYVVSHAGIAIEGISDVFTGLTYLTPNTCDHASIMFNDNSQVITSGTHTYHIDLMYCDGEGRTWAFTTESTNNLPMVFNYNPTDGWVAQIDTFIEAADDTTAQSNSTANPNRIYYVPET